MEISASPLTSRMEKRSRIFPWLSGALRNLLRNAAPLIHSSLLTLPL